MGRKDLVCPVCGAPTRVYMGNARKDRLCGEHADMLKNGEMVLMKNGKYAFPFIPDNAVDFEDLLEDEEETFCVICGELSFGKPQCIDCYYETRDFVETLDRNSTVRALRDYYYNLKERILIIKTVEEAQKQCNKLIAIAMLAKESYRDTSLIDRVYKDVETLLKHKSVKTKVPQYEEEHKEKDETKGRVNTAFDGHIVDSDMEVRIDDALYDSCILHCYGKNISEIIEKRKKCDWFVPVLNGEGIYIEYWGMKSKKYLEDRAEKEALYEKYNIPYIGIAKDEPKQDTQTFRNNLIRELQKIAEERWGFMPKWKK